MIPIHLSISGFLSYNDPVQVDFTAFDLACISGPNGAGKSSLLDAITWALFGEARKKDDSVINLRSKSASVRLVFAYEGNIYSVQRIKPREKTAQLEFHILQPPESSSAPVFSGALPDLRHASWKPLNEATLRLTEGRIRDTLRMDFDTFINASFFLQGKADQFTQQRPTERKRILTSILGLEIWEQYKQRAADRRKAVESELRLLDGVIQEINLELAEEADRKQRLAELESEVSLLAGQRQAQENLLAQARLTAETIRGQQESLLDQRRQLEAAETRLLADDTTLADRRSELETFTALLHDAAAIDADYRAWQDARASLESMDLEAARFRDQESARQAPLLQLQAEQSRLETELSALDLRRQGIETADLEIHDLETQAAAEQALIQELEQHLEGARELAQAQTDLQKAISDLEADNTRLKADMEELNARLTRLRETEGGECPLCGQPLGPAERLALIDQLQSRGALMGDTYRSNRALAQEHRSRMTALAADQAALEGAQADLRRHTGLLAALDARLDALRRTAEAWRAEGLPRLAELSALLHDETFAPDARRQLAEIDLGLKRIGYDLAAHDALRRLEQDLRPAVERWTALGNARAALAPLEREIASLQQRLELEQTGLDEARRRFQAAEDALAALQAAALDPLQVEDRLAALQEQENRLRMDLGAARTRLDSVARQKTRLVEEKARRDQLARQISQYLRLERAFGKDGVPALLIEQALPEIETRANDILDRLSNHTMSVTFATQAQYKDKTREDLKETLDILISDGAGLRDYELYSGGEAFRVNFAIRLALSELLARRAGARLQTLVIDEGFGSQDLQGRQRLIEAINLVRPDFEKVLVITHIDELKDAFPHRIEVEKTDTGSTVRVI